MSVRTMARVWERSSHAGTELLMLLAIADFADDEGRAYPSISTLAAKCRTKPRYAIVLIDALSRSGELEVHKNKGPMGRGGRTNLYRVMVEKMAGRIEEGMHPSAVVNQSAVVHPSAGSSEPGFREVVNQGAPKPSGTIRKPSSSAADHPSDGLAAGKPKAKRSTKTKEPGKTVTTWQAYSEAFERRHGAKPIRNQTVNGQLSRFVDQVGAEESPAVAAFYVGCEDQFYLRAMHPISLLLRDASKLRTLWATGRAAPAVAGGQQNTRSVASLWGNGSGQQEGAKSAAARPGKHAGFENLNYREGVNPDGSLA